MSGIPAGAGSLLGKRLGKYEILALLALGGTAEIYLARIAGAAGFEKYVVVKCLHDHLADDQTFVKMFLDEARLAAMLDHSNIVQTMELGEYENRYFMVMEFLAGLSLAMIVRRAGERLQGGKIPVQLVLNMVAQSCAGLHYAHERTSQGKPLNIVHRDISPQNLVVSFEGVVKVVDFGIAKAEHRETKTQSGTIKGKFAYMSPEQCVATNVDRRTDVFALGVIAHELLTGRRLFKKPSPYETYQAVIECNVQKPSTENVEIDPALDPIIMKALAKDKENRYQTAEAFGDAILGYLHHRGKGSSPNDVSRFFDQHFGQEIEEHGARMRELISGRDVSIDTGVNWDDEDEKDKERKDETVDLGGPQKNSAMSLDTGDIVDESRQSGSGLQNLIDDLGTGDRSDGDDDMPAERTRIEANPLEKVRELEKAAGNTPKPQITRPPVEDPAITKETPRPELLRKPGKTPAPQQKAIMPPSGPLPLPPAPGGPKMIITPPGMKKAPSSGKFPDLSNLPTMIAEPDETPPPGSLQASSPELAPTAMVGETVDPNGPTSVQMAGPDQNGQPQQSMPSSPSQPMRASAPPMQQQVQRPPSSQQMQRQSMQQLSNLPTSYPVMSAEMRAGMASGATVFPSPTRGRDSRAPMTDSGPQDQWGNPQRAADLASPVGPQYGEQVDWAQAAAAPARAIPPWLLAVIFVGAIGVALTITIIIARIVR
jgi:serine/threonine protein kinase